LAGDAIPRHCVGRNADCKILFPDGVAAPPRAQDGFGLAATARLGIGMFLSSLVMSFIVSTRNIQNAVIEVET
jgi:hypothetical protein